MQKSLSIINHYIELYGYGLICNLTEAKGRVLEAAKNYSPGAVVLAEHPLYSVAVDEDNWLYQKVAEWTKEQDFDYEPLWYWCALCSRLTEEDKDYVAVGLQQLPPKSANYDFFAKLYKILMSLPLPKFRASQAEKLSLFCAPVGSEPLRATIYISNRMADILMLDERPDLLPGRTESLLWERIKSIFSSKGLEASLQAWVHNCFEIATEPLTYSVYFVPTFSSHSCQPNTVWTLDDSGKFVLMARTSIVSGEEITLSYLGDSDLFMPAWRRKQELSDTKHFVCTCERCTNATDLSRGFRCAGCGVGSCFLRADREMPSLTDLDTDPTSLKEIKIKLDAIAAEICCGAADDAVERKLALGKPLAMEWWRLGHDDLKTALAAATLTEAISSLEPETCNVCNRPATAEEIAQALHFEALVAAALEANAASSKAAESWYKRILTKLTQHYFVVCFINDYVLYIKERCPAIAQRLLMRKTSIQRRMLGFPTAQLAYTFMDIMEIGWTAITGNQEALSLSPSTLQALVKSETVFPIAFNALFVFGLIFPYNSEYYTDCLETLMTKISILKQQEQYSVIEAQVAQLEHKMRNVRKQLNIVCRRKNDKAGSPK